MKIRYIYHSGFLAETDEASFLFDYYRGGLPETDPALPLYVFASHSHQDHFDPEIFRLAGRPGVRFILSRDIAEQRKAQIPPELSDRTVFLGPDESWSDSLIRVSTLKSTDEGVAFLVGTGGKLLFHAGDLNDWQWDGEPDDWNVPMRKEFRRIVEPLRGRETDVLFFPLDPRQEQYASCGLDYLLTVIRPAHIFPMHFADSPEITSAYAARHPELAGFHAIHENGECFDI